MKITKLFVSALMGLIINAASAENYSAEIKYASDFFYRGALKSSEAVQSSVGFSTSSESLGFSAGAFTNQATGAGSDTYILVGGISKTFAEDLISAYTGINHVEDVSGEALLEAQVSIGLNWVLSPRVNLYRDLEASLYTYELEVGHDLDFEIFSLGLRGVIGNTDYSESTDNTYYSIGASASRKLSENVEIGVGVAHVDSDTISNEYVVDLGFSLSF